MRTILNRDYIVWPGVYVRESSLRWYRFVETGASHLVISISSWCHMTNIVSWSERQMWLFAVSARGHVTQGHLRVTGHRPYRGRTFLFKLQNSTLRIHECGCYETKGQRRLTYFESRVWVFSLRNGHRWSTVQMDVSLHTLLDRDKTFRMSDRTRRFSAKQPRWSPCSSFHRRRGNPEYMLRVLGEL